jgi:hypothetical protein
MMETISIQQPWAWLILNHGKDLENRSRWHYKHRGRVQIHASKTVDSDTSRFPVQWAHIASLGIEIPWDSLTTGAIIGEATITGVVTESDSPWFEGPTAITLSDPVAYADPIPYRGQLGIFQAQI